MSKIFLKDYSVTASITEHRDGSATLRTSCGKIKTCKKYKSKKNALAAWRRMCQ